MCKACQFPSSSKRERERVCSPSDSPHDAAGGEQIRSLSLSQLPDSAGIDLGQLVWAALSLEAGLWECIIQLQDDRMIGWVRLGEACGQSLISEAEMLSESIAIIQCHTDHRQCFPSFKNVCSSWICCKHTNYLGKWCIPHGNQGYRSCLQTSQACSGSPQKAFQARLEEGIVWERQDKRAVPLPPS